MEIKGTLQKGWTVIKKYRYVALVLMIGLVLMLIPANNITQNKSVKEDTSTKHTASLDQALAAALAQVEGAGKVSVLLTTAAGEETVYQTDANTSESGSSYTTVTITDAERNQTGLIKQVIPPTYLGALVICEGADDPEVRLCIVSAVSRVTGLGTNQISVLKMK